MLVKFAKYYDNCLVVNRVDDSSSGNIELMIKRSDHSLRISSRFRENFIREGYV